MNKWILLTFLVLMTSASIFAQGEAPCATASERTEWLKKFQESNAVHVRSNNVYYVPLTIHVVGDSDGEGYLSITTILDMFCTLNEDFSASNIQFFIEPYTNQSLFHYINNSSYYEHSGFQTGAQMANANNRWGTVNTYFVKEARGACGYAWQNGLAIVLDNDCMVNASYSHTWGHEAGHYFSLPHTFSGWEDIDDYNYNTAAPNSVGGRAVERVNGSNCTFAGDGFCDTEPDYLNIRWNCNGDGQSPVEQTDPTGVKFRSAGKYLMSYSLGNCSDRFSNTQTNAIRANLEFQHPDHISDDSPQSPLPDGVVPDPAFPDNGETLSYYEGVTLEWTAIPNATHYYVTVSRLPTFGSVTFNGLLTENSVDLTGLLESDKRYYWKVIAFNRYDACSEFSPRYSFRTGEQVSSVREVEGLSGMTIFPNPLVASNREVHMQFSLEEQLSLSLTITDLAGRVLQVQKIQGQTGRNNFDLSVENLSKGMYLVGIESAGGKSYRKLIIQ